MASETPRRETPSASTPRKLDTMSQEDLLKTCKKQMVLLQKLKAKSDDLQSKLNVQSDYAQVKEELSSTKQLLETSSSGNEILKQEGSELKKSNNAMSEELECVKLKQETLLSSLQCLQDDYNKVLKEKDEILASSKHSQGNVDGLREKLKDMSNERQDLNDQLSDKSQQLSALKMHIKKLNEKEHNLLEINDKLTKENKDTAQELSALQIALDMFKTSQKSNGDKSDKEIKQLNNIINNLNNKVEELTAEKKRFSDLCDQYQKDKEAQMLELGNASSNLKDLSEQYDAVSAQKGSLEVELSSKDNELSQIRNEVSNLKKEHQEKDLQLQEECFQKVSKAEEALSKTLQECSELQKQVSLFQQENLQLQLLNSELDDRISSAANGQAEDLTNRLAILNEELQSSQIALADVESEKNVLLSDLENLRSESENLTSEANKQKEETMKCHNEELNIVQQQLENVKSELNSLQIHNSELMASNNSDKLKLATLHEEMKLKEAGSLESATEQRTMCEELKSKLCDATNIYENLKVEHDKTCADILLVQESEQTYKGKVSELESVVQEQFHEVDKFKAETEQHMCKMNEKHELLNQVSEELTSVKKINQQLEEEVSRLKNQLTSKYEADENLNDSIRDELFELNSQLSKAKTDYEMLKETFNSEKASYEEVKSCLQIKLNESAKQQESFENEIQRLNSDLAASIKDLQLKDEKLSDVADQNLKWEDTCKKYEENITQLNEVHVKSETINQGLSARVDEVCLQLKDAETCKEDLTKQFQFLQEELDISKAKVEELSSTIAVKDKALTELHEDANAFHLQHEEDVRKHSEQINQIEMERNKLNDEVVKIRDELIQFQTQHDKLLKSNNDEQSQMILDLNAKLVSAETQEDESKHLLQKANEEISSWKEKMNFLEEGTEEIRSLNKENLVEIQKLNASLAEAINQRDEDEKAKRTLSSELEELKLHYNEIKEALKDAEDKVHDAVKVHEVLQTASDEKNLIVDNMQKTNDELRSQIKKLSEECESLQSQMETLKTSQLNESDVAEENTPQKEIETLQQSIKERESYTTKLKMIAVKAKKELDATKQVLQSTQDKNSELQSKINELNNKLMGSQAKVASGAQLMQEEFDKLQDKIDQIRCEKSALQKTLEENLLQISNIHAQKEGLQSKLTSALSEAERLKRDKQENEKLLSSARSNVTALEKENAGILKEKQVIKQEFDASNIQTSSLAKELEATKQQLEAAKASLSEANKNIKQNDLMSLEMAQYEATVCGLQTQVSDLEVMVNDREVKIHELEKKVDDLNEDRRQVEKLRIEAEERVTRGMAALDESRDQVAHLSEVEHEVRGQLEVMSEQMENLQQQHEEQKLELSQKLSEIRVLEEKSASSHSTSQRKIEVLERRLQNALDEATSLGSEKDLISRDYESYKVRVHSVLKQQKNKDLQQQQTRKEEAELIDLRTRLNQVTAKLEQSQTILASRDHELDLLQGDYDRILRQQQQSSEGALERETRWKSRVKSLQQELAALRKQHADVTAKLQRQSDVTEASIAAEVDAAREEQEKSMEAMREKLRSKEEEIEKLTGELKARVEEKQAAPKRPPIPPPLYRHHSTAEHHVDYRSVARESGEGEENPDEGSVVSFEQILQTPHIKSVTELSETASLTSEVQLKQLEAKFAAVTKQLEHSSDVARENESTALRLADQNKVLKEEIRRMEKNQEREASVSNMEYLKNVVYKFCTLPPCDERRHLVPVIDMMLKLNKEEMTNLQAIANGEEGSEERGQSGWGSYLQRWSGMQ